MNRRRLPKPHGATGTPVILDFHADWCAPCRRVTPLLADLGREFEGKIRIVGVNVDTESAMVDRYGVYSLPTVVFIQDEHEISRLVGAKDKAQYRAAIIKSLHKSGSSIRKRKPLQQKSRSSARSAQSGK